MRRVQVEESAAGGVFSDPLFSEMYPHLWEHLTVAQWDDGKPRVLSTLLVLTEGLWKGWLNNKAEGLSAWFSASGFDELLLTIEQSLAEGRVEWRRATPHGGRRK